MAKEVKKKAAVPKLRFPEFADQPLSEVRLSDVTAESSIRNGDGGPAGRVMGVSKVLGIVPMEERIVASDIARYKLVKKDWFAYNPMRLNIGSIARWYGDADILVSPDYVVFQCRDEPEFGIEPSYMDHFRQSTAWDAFVSEGGDGGVRVRIYYKDVARLELALPGRAEQQKIANCLTSLDELIAAQGRKVEALKTYKRGLMQQLLPREGEALPRLRFPEFRDAPEWEETKLASLGELVSGLTYSPEDVRESGLLVLRSSNVQNAEIALDDNVYVTPGIKGANLVRPNDILVCVRNGSKTLIGKSALIPEGMPLCTHGAFMTVFRAHAPQFAFQLMQSALFHKQVAADLGATINSINGSQLLRYRFVVPGPDEQNRIADFLSSLTARITTEAKNLVSLKALKKGLMPQLFPSQEEQ